jgi:hypothetical protein
VASLEAVLAAANLWRPIYDLEMWRYAAELKLPTDDPDRPFIHRPDAAGRFYGVEIRTNSRGWRGDREALTPKPADAFRVFVVGDSIPLGWGVREEDTLARRLEDGLRRGGRPAAEVFNAAVGNYNSACALAAFRECLGESPDAVVFAFYINDIERLKPSSPWRRAVLGRLRLYGLAWSIASRARYAFGLAEPYDARYRRLYRDGSPERAALTADLDAFRRASEEARVPLLVLNVPEMHGFDPYPFAEVTELVRQRFAGSPTATFVDATAAFAAHPPRSLWVSGEDPHPNALGHRLLADLARRALPRPAPGPTPGPAPR